MRILYVEDNEVNQALVARVSRAKHCDVVFRTEGEAALELLAEDEDIDLILLDIELAGAMNGIDVVTALRARHDTRPVVAITAYAMMGDRERILAAGCDQYLPKPLVITDILTLFDEYAAKIDGPRAAQQPSNSGSAAAPAADKPAADEPATPTANSATKPSDAPTTPSPAAPTSDAAKPAAVPAVPPPDATASQTD